MSAGRNGRIQHKMATCGRPRSLAASSSPWIPGEVLPGARSQLWTNLLKHNRRRRLQGRRAGRWACRFGGPLSVFSAWHLYAGRCPCPFRVGPTRCAVTEEKGTIMNSTVKDVMTTNVVAIGESANYKDIIIAMIARRVSACPVLDVTGRVVGVVSEADLLLKELGPEHFDGPGASLRASGRRGERAKANGMTAAELMSTPGGDGQPGRGRG